MLRENYGRMAPSFADRPAAVDHIVAASSSSLPFAWELVC